MENNDGIEGSGICTCLHAHPKTIEGRDGVSESTSGNEDVGQSDSVKQETLLVNDSECSLSGEDGHTSIGQSVDECNEELNRDTSSVCEVKTTNQESASFMFFNELPSELFFKILSYLTAKELCWTVALVSREWHEYSNNAILWQHLDLSENRNINHDQLSMLLKRATLLRSLSLRGRDHLAITGVQMLKDCPLLTKLNIGFCDTPKGKVLIGEIITSCPCLEVLNMEGCVAIDDKAVSQLQHLICLKSLNLSHCTQITDDGIVMISQGCVLLQELNVDGIPWITDRAVNVLVSERSQTLRAVFLDGAELTDASASSLIGCSFLHTLSLSFCEQFTDRTLNMLKTLHHLQYLRLKRGLEFTEDALCQLFEHANLQQLTDLDMSECPELMDKAIIIIAARCLRLQKLTLSWCWNISDAGIQEIVKNCSDLKHLDIIGLDKVKGQYFSCIPDTLPRLVFLDVRQCNLMNDNMLVDLVKAKPDLCIYDYYGEQVTADSLN